MVDSELHWHCYRARNCLVLTPQEDLDVRTYRVFRNGLVKFAMDQPRALVVIVDRLRIGSVASLAAFTSAWMRISEWPGVPILLVARQAAMRAALAGSTVSRYMAVYGSLHAAMTALSEPPLRRRSEIELVAVAASSRVARTFVHRTCTDWDVADRIPDAESVATELVENSIIHADTDLRLRLELHDGRLAVAVRDGSPREAVLREDGRAGSGLRLVAELATAWGCAPDSAGGKVVWAVLSRRRP